MKSRWTTYLLLAVVVAVWGIVGWKIFTPATDTSPASAPRAVAAGTGVAADTLLADYPDPFLKGAVTTLTRASQPVVRALPPAPARREQVRIVHLATVVSGGRPLYILTIGNEQYELVRGASAEGFELTGCDRDSVYLRKSGVTYGVKLCE